MYINNNNINNNNSNTILLHQTICTQRILKGPSNRRLYEHGICIRHCQDSNSQPVSSQVRADSTRPRLQNYWFRMDLVTVVWGVKVFSIFLIIITYCYTGVLVKLNLWFMNISENNVRLFRLFNFSFTLYILFSSCFGFVPVIYLSALSE